MLGLWRAAVWAANALKPLPPLQGCSAEAKINAGVKQLINRLTVIAVLLTWRRV
jgi:hypothetical protein